MTRALDDIALTVGYAWLICVLVGVVLIIALQAARLCGRLNAGRRASRAAAEPLQPTDRLISARRLGVAVGDTELYWTTSVDSGRPVHRHKVVT